MRNFIEKIFFIYIFIISCLVIYAQEARVGINTTNPKSTLDVNGKTDELGVLLATDVTGLQAPRLTREELSTKGDVLYGSDQKGTLIYITDVSGGNVLNQRKNITSIGYYYFDGNEWKSIGEQWKLDGNSNGVLKSLGTKDKIDLPIIVNDIEAFRIKWDDPNNTSRILIGTTLSSTVASSVSGSSVALQSAKLTLAGGDVSVNGVTVGKGGGQLNTNTALGEQVLYNNTSGYNNTAIGRLSLTSNTTGHSNSVVGERSMASNTTGFHNAAIGQLSLASNTSGYYNYAMGSEALLKNTTGHDNTALGIAALHENTAGNYNIGIGTFALYNSISSNNVAIGWRSMLTNTNGSENTAIGANSLLFNSSGSSNTAIGFNSLTNNKGSNNVGIGNSTLNGSGSSSTGSNNTSIGYYSLSTLTTGSNNIGIGYNTTVGNTTNNNIVIGSSQSTVSSTASNQLNIGGAIFGVNLTGNITTPAGRIGIVKNNPAYTLDVGGDINSSGLVRASGVALTSDIRLKKDITKIDNALSIIDHLNPVFYQKKFSVNGIESYKKEYGLIAQEVEKILPSLVIEGEDKDKTLSLNYTELIPILIKSIQEQQIVIKNLEKKVYDLSIKNKLVD